MLEKIKGSELIYKNDNNTKSDTLLLKKYLFQIDSLGSQMRLISDSFSKKFIGWRIEHQFEVQNAFFVNSIINTTFYFDSLLSKIVKYRDNYSTDKMLNNFDHKVIEDAIFKRHLYMLSLRM